MLVRIFLLMTSVAISSAQLNAQSSVAPELRECYTDPQLLDRNNLPPMTMPVLIDIIQKIEDQVINIDLRQLAVLLLHTYRQDGIEYHQPDVSYSSNVLPYAPTYHSFYRHRLLLSKLIPNNGNVAIGNDTLTSKLKCFIHHAMSISVDSQLRGDENDCSSLAQYRALRTPRHVMPNNDDVEILDISSFKNNGGNQDSERQVLGTSSCPIAEGVVYSSWGALSAGSVIAGIAAGEENQQVSITNLIRSTGITNTNYQRQQTYVTSIYPATLSGDLAEAVLIQGTETGSLTISVGITGGWNSTQARKYYMLRTTQNLQMTDPEIRGGLDGFILGRSVSSMQSSFSSMKLSQYLDMYYSPRNGAFDVANRACNRVHLSQDVINYDTLATETYAFATALDTNIPLRGTITSGIEDLVVNAVTNFQSYVTNNLNDVTCTTTEATFPDYRLKTNLYLVVDSTWQYSTVYPAISYLLDSIEVGKYGSSVTLISAYDGSVVVNKTFSLADFHTNYTSAVHTSIMLGVNLEHVFSNIRTLLTEELEHEKSINYSGGNSTVLLFLLATSNLQNNDAIYEEARQINNTLPDLRVLFATSSSQINNLWNLVRDMHHDIMTVSLQNNGLNVDTSFSDVLTRVKSVNRRIVSSHCGAEWNSGTSSGSRSFEDFLEPGYINYYAISANYFYQNNDNRLIRIIRSTSGSGSLYVCHSRTVSKPRMNDTQTSEMTCETLASSGNIEIRLQNLCGDYSTINSCPNMYLSVESTGTESYTAICTDSHCRFPYNIRYQVQIEEFGCYSSAIKNQYSFLLFLALSVSFIRNYS